MQWLLDFFGSIADSFSNVLQFFLGAFKGLIQLVGQIPAYISLITSAFSDLPPVFQLFLTATFAVTVIFLALGRGEGGD